MVKQRNDFDSIVMAFYRHVNGNEWRHFPDCLKSLIIEFFMNPWMDRVDFTGQKFIGYLCEKTGFIARGEITIDKGPKKIFIYFDGDWSRLTGSKFAWIDLPSKLIRAPPDDEEFPEVEVRNNSSKYPSMTGYSVAQYTFIAMPSMSDQDHQFFMIESDESDRSSSE